jgi:hypothetical protein
MRKKTVLCGKENKTVPCDKKEGQVMGGKDEGNYLVRRKDARCVVRWKKTVWCGKEKWILCSVVKNKESVLCSEKERAFCV